MLTQKLNRALNCLRSTGENTVHTMAWWSHSNRPEIRLHERRLGTGKPAGYCKIVAWNDKEAWEVGWRCCESPCSFPASTCGSQPPETSVPGDLMHSSDACRHQTCMWLMHMHTCRQNTHKLKINNLFFFFLRMKRRVWWFGGVKCLLQKHDDLSLAPQQPCKKQDTVVHTCDTSARAGDTVKTTGSLGLLTAI